MSDTSIEWTRNDDGTPGKTWNPLRGCTEVSPGCAHCYAATVAARFSGPGLPYEGLAYRDANGKAHWTGKVRTVPEKLAEPLHWRKPTRVFVNSMSDLFHEDVSDEFIADVFAVMAVGNWHTYQVLTKRARRMAKLVGSPWFPASVADAIERLRPTLETIRGDWGLVSPVSNGIGRGLPGYWPLESVWLGVSAEDQKRADERIPHLLATPAAVRFLSCEPLLGPVDLRTGVYETFAGHRGTCLDGIDWVIVGGESGPNARASDLRWIRSVVAQCKAAGVPAFVKQVGADVMDSGGGDGTFADHWPDETRRTFFEGDDTYKVWLRDKKGGDWAEWPDDIRVREFPGTPAGVAG